MDSGATKESGISDANDLRVNVTNKCQNIIFETPCGSLGNQRFDFLSTEIHGYFSKLNSFLLIKEEAC
jgi:hypothetical protein